MGNKTENLTTPPQLSPQDSKPEESSEGMIDRLIRFLKNRSELEDEDNI